MLITKKPIILIVCALIMLSMLGGCGKPEEEIDFNPEISQELENNLMGAKINYALCAATLYGNTKANNNFGFVPGTTFSDLALAREKEVETTYNCTIVPFYASNGASVDSFNTAVTSGQFYCDVIQSSSEFMIDTMAAGGLVSISGELSDVIDWQNSAKWGGGANLESGCYNNNLYELAPMAWPELVYTSFGYPIVFNETAVKNAGIADLREYQERNEWNWSTFHSVLETLTYDDGGTQVYGMTVHPAYLAEMIIRSNGAHYLSVTNEGKVECGFYTQEARKAEDEIRELYLGAYADCFYKKDDGAPDAVVQNFVDGRALMTACDTEHIYGVNAKISMNMENFGIMKCPVGPDVPNDYAYAVHESLRYAIAFPITGDYTEEAAIAINAMYEPFDEYPDRDSIVSIMKISYFFNDADATTFFSMFNNTEYNYFYLGGRDLSLFLVTSKSKNTAQILETAKDTIAKKIEDKTANMRLSRISLFGN